MKLTKSDRALILRLLWKDWSNCDSLAESNPRIIDVQKAARACDRILKLIKKLEETK